MPIDFEDFTYFRRIIFSLWFLFDDAIDDNFYGSPL